MVPLGIQGAGRNDERGLMITLKIHVLCTHVNN
jgi:hypothetical protein